MISHTERHTGRVKYENVGIVGMPVLWLGMALLEKEYGGGSMFEFRAKMTVVKKQPIRDFFNPL